MQMVARVRVVVDVPYDYDVQPPDETGFSQSRVDATAHANDVILDQVKQSAGTSGTVVNDLCIIEEVREEAQGAPGE